MQYRTALHPPPGEAMRETERVSLNGQRKRHTVTQMALKDDVERWQKSLGMGICSSGR